jgi:hypothetical protein
MVSPLLAGNRTAGVAIFFAWIALAVIVWVAASRRGRIGFGWFLLSLLVSPVITGPLVLVLPRRYAGAQTGATGGRTLSGILKGFGLAILVVGFVVLAMMVISLVLIIQHGGA